MAQTDRDVAFANESFLIGVLQAVSGGSIVAAVSQTEAFIRLAGKIPVLLFITMLSLSLLSAVLAAYWKHEYKKWDVKARVAASQGEIQRARARAKSARSALKRMRGAMGFSVVAILVGYGILVAMMWLHQF